MLLFLCVVYGEHDTVDTKDDKNVETNFLAHSFQKVFKVEKRKRIVIKTLESSFAASRMYN